MIRGEHGLYAPDHAAVELWIPPQRHAVVGDLEAEARRGVIKKSPEQRLREARKAQWESGTRIRVARKVKNLLDFAGELAVWRAPVQDRSARRKDYGALGMTVFDTKQTPLRTPPEESEEELRERLAFRCPELFETSEPHKVSGLRIFHNNQRDFVVLALEAAKLKQQERMVRLTIAPELALDDSHQQVHTPHITLGIYEVPGKAQRILPLLEPVIPRTVTLLPIELSISKAD